MTMVATSKTGPRPVGPARRSRLAIGVGIPGWVDARKSIVLSGGYTCSLEPLLQWLEDDANFACTESEPQRGP